MVRETRIGKHVRPPDWIGSKTSMTGTALDQGGSFVPVWLIEKLGSSFANASALYRLILVLWTQENAGRE
jgi:hypothetical protein